MIHTINDCKGPRKVYVDGKLVEFVTYADTDNGIVRKYKLGADGVILFDEEYALEEEIRGKVEVVFPGCW
jgi:hypothetical protein